MLRRLSHGTIVAYVALFIALGSTAWAVAVNSGHPAALHMSRDDYAATGALPQDSEDLINYTRSVAGVEVGLFFMEQPRGGVKVSFRSRAKVDVGKLAESFGGGGHRLASGATVDAPLDVARARVLQAVATALHA